MMRALSVIGAATVGGNPFTADTAADTAIRNNFFADYARPEFDEEGNLTGFSDDHSEYLEYGRIIDPAPIPGVATLIEATEGIPLITRNIRAALAYSGIGGADLSYSDRMMMYQSAIRSSDISLGQTFDAILPHTFGELIFDTSVGYATAGVGKLGYMGWITAREGMAARSVVRTIQSTGISVTKPGYRIMASQVRSDIKRGHGVGKKYHPRYIENRAKGALGEYSADRALLRSGYTKLETKLPGDKGIDGAWVKFDQRGNVQDIIVTESKFARSGRGRLGLTKGDIPQMSDDWIMAKLAEMRDSKALAVERAGDLLFRNHHLIRRKVNVLDAKGQNRWHTIELPKTDLFIE
jgi:hypothetical protein